MGKNKATEYIQKMRDLLYEIESTQMEAIMCSAEVIADTVASGGLIYVFGSGHAQIFAQELFYRAGGLVQVNGILEQPLSFFNKATMSTWFERHPGYGERIFEKWGITPKDILIIGSHSGQINVAIDLALTAKKEGVKVIALTSDRYSDSFTSQHTSGLLLKDIADIVIDDCAPAGDAIVEIDELNLKVAAATTVTGCAVLQSIVAQVIDNLCKQGIIPPVWMSSNLDGGDAINSNYIKNYSYKIRNL